MTSTPKISKLLIDLLPLYREVRIAGIGCFCYKHIDQYLGSGKGLILPPTIRIVIRTNEECSRNLTECALKDGLIKRKEVKYIKKGIQRVINELYNFGKADFGDLGMLVKSEGGKLHLETPAVSINQASCYLPVLEINTLMAKGKADPDFKKKISEPPGVLTGNHESLGIWKGYVIPLVSIVIFTIIFVLILKRIFSNEQVLSNVEERLELPRQLQESSDELKDQNMFSNPLHDKYDDILSQKNLDEGCEIVIGSFTNKKNVENALVLIAEKSYVSFTKRNGKFTRVGVRFDCNTRDLKTYLWQVREDLSPQAWYLSPRINDKFELITSQVDL